ncbi:hypothetical protein [Anthocerotibacter panamensis]|uniref:hypothetical protein n=1 Tax=Anthocerotibacter panamensis TaxID=2857077 RepID=UPI001C4027DD|nr:hypothetical protein [Anthocerotibacter panamensis]
MSHRTRTPAPSILARELAPNLRTVLKFGPGWWYLPAPPKKGALPIWEAVSIDFVRSLIIAELDAHSALGDGFTAAYLASVLVLLRGHLLDKKGGKEGL